MKGTGTISEAKVSSSLDKLSKLYPETKIPEHTYSHQEFVLLLELLYWIGNKSLGIKNRRIYFEGKSSELKNWLEPLDMEYIADYLSTLSETQVDQLSVYNSPITEQGLELDVYGSWLQHSLEKENRKTMASNYTRNAQAIMSKVIRKPGKNISVIDPFCGSGRLVTSAIDLYPELIDEIHINDLSPTAAVLAYARTLQKKGKYNLELDVHVSVGDGFSLSKSVYLENKRYDLVLINPPFTRSHRIDADQRESLQIITDHHNLNGQPGLHIYALFLCLGMLDQNAEIFAVLPSSTFLSNYSEDIKNFLASGAYELSFYSSGSEKSFSEDSIFSEMILHAIQVQEHSEARFCTLDEDDLTLTRENRVWYKILQDDWNWPRYFRDSFLLRFREKLLDHLNNASELRDEIDISRGIEMYGPNFFFFPNKIWSIEKKSGKHILISKDGKHRITIDGTYFQPILRQPKLYSDRITPIIEQYVLCIPPHTKDLDNSLQNYIKTNYPAGEVARKKFGENWLSHPAMQIDQKAPLANLFLIDKISLNTVGVMTHYLDELTICTKNFYFVKLKNADPELLAAWLNSSMYLALYLCSRREIGGSYGRLQISDYYKEKLFPVAIFDPEISKKKEKINQLKALFKEYRLRNISSMSNQLKTPEKLELDLVLDEILGLGLGRNNLVELQSELRRILDTIALKD